MRWSPSPPTATQRSPTPDGAASRASDYVCRGSDLAVRGEDVALAECQGVGVAFLPEAVRRIGLVEAQALVSRASTVRGVARCGSGGSAPDVSVQARRGAA